MTELQIEAPGGRGVGEVSQELVPWYLAGWQYVMAVLRMRRRMLKLKLIPMLKLVLMAVPVLVLVLVQPWAVVLIEVLPAVLVVPQGLFWLFQTQLPVPAQTWRQWPAHETHFERRHWSAWGPRQAGR